MAFKEYDFVGGIANSPWADPLFKHFKMFFSSPSSYTLLRNTFLISLYKLIFGIIPPVLLAIVLNECRIKKLRASVQSLSFIPYFLSWVIIYGILLAMLSQTNGILNKWLIELIGAPQAFLTSPQWFRTILVISDIWKNTGFNTIIYIAAITSIDLEMFEAARVDGASRLRVIQHITLPCLLPTIVMLMTLRLGTILDTSFEQIYVMYSIEVYNVADIIDTWVYRTGVQQLNFGLAAAAGLFKSVISLALVLIAQKLSKKMGGSIW